MAKRPEWGPAARHGQCGASFRHQNCPREPGPRGLCAHPETKRGPAWAEAEPLSVARGCGAWGLWARLVGPWMPIPSGESSFVQKGCDQQKVQALFRVEPSHFVKKSLTKLAIR